LIKAADAFKNKTTAQTSCGKPTLPIDHGGCPRFQLHRWRPAKWLNDRHIKHAARPDHRSSDAHGKIKHWHQTLKNRILLENYFLPGDLEKPVEFVQLGVVTDATGESPRVPMAAGAVCPRSAGLGLAERVGG
jgi:hypothetical protein